MDNLLETLAQQLGGGAVQEMSRKLGTDEGATGKALSAALPMLVSALSRNASTPEGAGALSRALERDHDGSLLDNLGGYMSAFQGNEGDGILGHVLGGRRGAVESNISRSSGLDAGSVAKLLSMAAPLVMAALGRNRRSRGLDVGGLADMLGAEQREIGRRAPAAGGLLGSLLDQDGDGDISDDVAKVGLDFLGKYLQRGR
jgi:hypothetical protein